MKHNAMKMHRGVDVYIHIFFTSALVGGGQLHAPASLSLEKEPPVPIG
jgi:hypothetical protein